ncbi:hypothetical protein [Pseudomonas sp. NPDC007930]|uniref:hypothetical protein n=1 Tax=Pseudomonas sp. NPDC007930 TaxID=3364417 RepID=UPI0036ECD959
MSISSITDQLQVFSLPSTKKSSDDDSTTSASAEFANLMAMSPEQRMRALILEQLGLSEKDLQNMPADQRAQIENKIAQIVKEKLGVGTEQATSSDSSGIDATAATSAATSASSAAAVTASAASNDSSASHTGSEGQPATDQADRLLALIRQATALS